MSSDLGTRTRLVPNGDLNRRATKESADETERPRPKTEPLGRPRLPRELLLSLELVIGVGVLRLVGVTARAIIFGDLLSLLA